MQLLFTILFQIIKLYKEDVLVVKCQIFELILTNFTIFHLQVLDKNLIFILLIIYFSVEQIIPIVLIMQIVCIIKIMRWHYNVQVLIKIRLIFK